MGAVISVLAEMFELTDERAAKCMSVWRQRLAEQGDLLERLEGCAGEGAAAKLPAALVECFGLSSSEATTAVRNLSARWQGRGVAANCDAPGQC